MNLQKNVKGNLQKKLLWQFWMKFLKEVKEGTSKTPGGFTEERSGGNLRYLKMFLLRFSQELQIFCNFCRCYWNFSLEVVSWILSYVRNRYPTRAYGGIPLGVFFYEIPYETSSIFFELLIKFLLL